MSRLEAYAWSPIIALQLLTRVPTPTVPDRLFASGSPARRYSLVFFPIVGAFVGLIAALAFMLAARIGLPRLGCAAIAIGAGVLLTGGFHEDGLADVGDSLGKADRDDALAVMRDSRIGAFGAVALWVVLTIKASAIAWLPIGHIVAAMGVAGAFSRTTPLLLISLLVPARKQGGRSSSAVTEGGWVQAAVGSAAAVGFSLAVIGGLHTVKATLLTFGVALLCALFFYRRFGGYTGDCLGATVAITETCLLCLFGAFFGF